jgi:hypothetical protein
MEESKRENKYLGRNNDEEELEGEEGPDEAEDDKVDPRPKRMDVLHGVHHVRPRREGHHLWGLRERRERKERENKIKK